MLSGGCDAELIGVDDLSGSWFGTQGEDRRRQITASINDISRLEPETIHQAKVDPGWEK